MPVFMCALHVRVHLCVRGMVVALVVVEEVRVRVRVSVTGCGGGGGGGGVCVSMCLHQLPKRANPESSRATYRGIINIVCF